MTIVVKEKANMNVVAEKTFMDTTYPSGKFGMYTKSQISACFSGRPLRASRPPPASR
jgi:hypothetical protein